MISEKILQMQIVLTTFLIYRSKTKIWTLTKAKAQIIFFFENPSILKYQ